MPFILWYAEHLHPIWCFKFVIELEFISHSQISSEWRTTMADFWIRLTKKAMQQQISKTIWRTYAMIHKPTIFKKQFGFSKDKPHQVLHSCDCYNTPGLLRSTKDVWWVRKKTVKRSASLSLEVRQNDPKWTAGRVRWAGSTQCLRTWGPRESRWVVWHCRRVFTTPESSRNGQAHERSIRQAF